MYLRHLILCLTPLLVLAGCSTARGPQQPERSEAEVKAQIVRLLPAKVADRNSWAQDIYTAFDTQHIYPSTENICAVPVRCMCQRCWSALHCNCVRPPVSPTPIA